MKIRQIIQISRDIRNVPKHIAEKTVMALDMPSLFGRLRQRGKPSKTEEIYEDFVIRQQDSKAYPKDGLKTLKYTDDLIDRTEMLTGSKRYDVPAEGRALHAGEEAIC